MAKWDQAYINDLPDQAFALILDGGEIGDDGKTTPRDLRKLPHHNESVESGIEPDSLDAAHLSNAIARVDQVDAPQEKIEAARKHLLAHRQQLIDVAKTRHVDVLSRLGRLQKNELFSCDTENQSSQKILAGRTVADKIEPGCDVVFVCCSPSANDAITGRLLSGAEGETFQQKYIKGIGRPYSVMSVAPVHFVDDDTGRPRDPSLADVGVWIDSLRKSLFAVNPKVVVALGKSSFDYLDGVDGVCDFWLPHPRSIRRFKHEQELTRKIKSIKAMLQDKQKSSNLYGQWLACDDDDELSFAKVSKADDIKQLVYGVVLEPDTVDTQKHSVSCEEIEKACHRYLENYRIIGEQHKGLADAVPVECFIAPFDYRVGDELIKRGSWVMAVKIRDRARYDKIKASIESGGNDGFSIGGFGRVEPRRD